MRSWGMVLRQHQSYCHGYYFLERYLHAYIENWHPFYDISLYKTTQWSFYRNENMLIFACHHAWTIWHLKSLIVDFIISPACFFTNTKVENHQSNGFHCVLAPSFPVLWMIKLPRASLELIRDRNYNQWQTLSEKMETELLVCMRQRL